MKKILLLYLLTSTTLATAQKISIKGQLLDTLNHPLSSATILILNTVDSSLVNFGISDANGNFLVRNIQQGGFIFKVTFLGFKTYSQKLNIPDNVIVFDLGQIKMKPV